MVSYFTLFIDMLDFFITLFHSSVMAINYCIVAIPSTYLIYVEWSENTDELLFLLGLSWLKRGSKRGSISVNNSSRLLKAGLYS